MPAVNIKQSNYNIIKDFTAGRARPELQGNKLRALFNLIQKKGEPITSSTDHTLLNLPCLEIAPGEYVAAKRTAYGPDFYHCAIKMYRIKNI